MNKGLDVWTYEDCALVLIEDPPIDRMTVNSWEDTDFVEIVLTERLMQE